VRAHCINTLHGDLWLSEDRPWLGERGVALSVDTADMVGPVWELAPSEVRQLREACDAFLREHGGAVTA
jgi:hypothetical protein